MANFSLSFTILLATAALSTACSNVVVEPDDPGVALGAPSAKATNALCAGKAGHAVEGAIDGEPLGACLHATGASYRDESLTTRFESDAGSAFLSLVGDGPLNQDGVVTSARGWLHLPDGRWLCGGATSVTLTGLAPDEVTAGIAFTWPTVRAAGAGVPVEAELSLTLEGLHGTLAGAPIDVPADGGYGGDMVTFAAGGAIGVLEDGGFLLLPGGGELYRFDALVPLPSGDLGLENVTRLGPCDAATPVSGSLSLSPAG